MKPSVRRALAVFVAITLVVGILAAPYTVGIVQAATLATIDDFEDGDTTVETSGWSDWSTTIPCCADSGFTFSASDTDPISGTYSGQLSISSVDAGNMETTTTRSSFTPTEVSWKFRIDTAHPDNHVEINVQSGSSLVMEVEFDGTRNIEVSNSDTGTDWSVDTEYEIRVYNIDFSNDQFDVEITNLDTDTVIENSSNHDFINSVSSVDRFQIITAEDNDHDWGWTIDDLQADDPNLLHTVSGTVKGSGGGGVEGATVDVNSTADSTTTGSDGSYSFTLTDGTYKLNATGVDCRADNSTTVTVSGSDLTGEDITMPLLAECKDHDSATDPLEGDLYRQEFELDSSTPLFNPQTSTLEAAFWRNFTYDEPAGAIDPTQGEWVLDDQGEFDFRNRTTLAIHDGVVYRLRVIDEGAMQDWVGWTGNEDAGLVILEVRGPDDPDDPIDDPENDIGPPDEPTPFPSPTPIETPTPFPEPTPYPTPTQPPTPTPFPTVTPPPNGTETPLPTVTAAPTPTPVPGQVNVLLIQPPLRPTTAEPGTITIHFGNPGDEPATETFDVVVNDRTIETVEVTVDSRAIVTEDVAWWPQETGEATIEVGDESTTVDVGSGPQTPTPVPTVTPPADGTTTPLPTVTPPPDEQGPFLDTGVFTFPEDGRCVGLRYWDPSFETTQLTYNFTALNTTYEDTIVFDEPVGYYETCIDTVSFEDGDPPENDSDGEFNVSIIHDDDWLNGTVGIGEGGGEFDFGTTDFGDGQGLPPGDREGGGGGGLGTTAAVVAAGGAAFYLRKPGRRRQVTQTARSAASTANETLRQVFRR